MPDSSLLICDPIGSDQSKAAAILSCRERDGTMRVLHWWKGELPWCWRFCLRLLVRTGILEVVTEQDVLKKLAKVQENHSA